jgi:hypothetical protein
MIYEFTLKFALPPEEADHAAVVERMGAAGCDDALVGIGQPGRLALEYLRKAASADRAIAESLAGVRRALPEARLIEVAPDLVGLTDIAGLLGVSRQAMRKLMLNHGVSFPVPVHEGNTILWHLAHVIAFLADRGLYEFEPALVEVAEAAMRANIVKESTMLGQVPINAVAEAQGLR